MRSVESAKVGIKTGLPSVVWALLGLLVAASVLFLFARDDTTSLPAAESTLPSGTAAFAELLRRDGFQVEIEPYKRPQLPKDALVIAFHVETPNFFQALSEEGPVADPAVIALEDWVEAGGTLIGIEVPRDFTKATKGARPMKAVRDLQDESNPVVVTNGPTPPPSFPIVANEPMAVWSERIQGEIASVGDIGKGMLVTVNDGLGATNRFIDKQANAQFFLDLVRTYATPSKRVVFAEGLLPTQRERGLLQDIGPYASAAWWQFVLLSVVVVFTLGKRFGLPEIERRRERGVRELVDAVASTMERGRQFPLALDLIARDVDLRIRRLVSLDNKASKQDRNRLIPPDLAAALNAAEHPGAEKLKPSEAQAIALRLLSAYSEFEVGAKRSLAGRRGTGSG